MLLQILNYQLEKHNHPPCIFLLHTQNYFVISLSLPSTKFICPRHVIYSNYLIHVYCAIMDDTPICLKLCGGLARFVFLAVITFYVGGVGSVTVMHFGRLLTTNNLWDNTNNQSTRPSILEMNKRSHVLHFLIRLKRNIDKGIIL